jgi:class 3 adenylate cyclase/pimeloyl-ACP methyl ester carboxylesterase
VASEKLERRLAAIVAADMVGYSRLVGVDEEGTITRLRELREVTIDPCIAEHNGRIVKVMGDGLLIEFSSVVDALRCAVTVQQDITNRESNVPEDRRIQFRVGINLGDIIIDETDILGDGVNIAARLEGLAEPGGICVSDIVQQSVVGKLALTFEDLGERTVKNIAKPVCCFAVRSAADAEAATDPQYTPAQQDIRFCRSFDGAQIAYAVTGQGPPIVKTANWLNHLEHDWLNPVWGHLVRELSHDHKLLRYDQRGNGLSDWEVEDLSFEAWVGDLETVVDAVGLDQFALLGISQGCAVSIAYAVRHPERVTHLILHGGYACGTRIDAPSEFIQKHEAMLTLISEGWAQENPAFRQMFTSIIVPDATAEQTDWFNELTRVSTSPEIAVRLFDEFSYIDVRALLSQVETPTLVTHSRNDARIPFEKGRELAASIPNARFVPLDTRNHLVVEQDKAWPRLLSEITDFLRSDDDT